MRAILQDRYNGNTDDELYTRPGQTSSIFHSLLSLFFIANRSLPFGVGDESGPELAGNEFCHLLLILARYFRHLFHTSDTF